MVAEYSLSKIATITMGTSPKGDTYNQNGEGIPLLNGPTEFGSVHPQCTLFTTKSVREGQSGDLIFCVRGSTTGRMNWADRDYSLGRGVCSIRGESVNDTRFIRYCLDWKLESLLKLAGGGTFPNLTQDTIRNFKIPFPEHRHKIASILSTYDDLIENNLRRIKILEEMAQALYREWFVKFRFPEHEKVRMVDSALGKIPEGWEVKKLGELTDVVTKGTTPTTLGKSFQEEGINFFKVESINEEGGIIENKLAKIDTETHELLKRSQLQAGDILFSIAGAIGRTTMLPVRALPANTNQALAIIRVPDEITRTYVYHSVRADSFQDFSLGRVVQTAQANVSLGILKSAPLVMPSGALLPRFINIVSPMLLEQENLRTKNTILRQTRDLLLPRLISGELDVSELEINIPEEVA